MEPAPSPQVLPGQSQQQQTLLPNEWEALKSLGFWQPIDEKFAWLIGIIWFLALFAFGLGHYTLERLIMVTIGTLVLHMTWLTVLVFRCCHFTLLTRGDINLMPAAAARIASAYITGGPMPGPPASPSIPGGR